MTPFLATTLICLGNAPTHPQTDIELKVRPPEQVSTIRYEYSEGSLSGTVYVQSVGYLQRTQKGSQVIYKSGDGPHATILSFVLHGSHIMDARLSHSVSGMNRTPVECSVGSSTGDGHGGH